MYEGLVYTLCPHDQYTSTHAPVQHIPTQYTSTHTGVAYTPNPDEVDEVFHMPLEYFLQNHPRHTHRYLIWVLVVFAVHTYTCTHVYIHMYTHTHVHTHTCIHTHAYTHMHTQTRIQGCRVEWFCISIALFQTRRIHGVGAHCRYIDRGKGTVGVQSRMCIM